jgi:hypothetical protein
VSNKTTLLVGSLAAALLPVALLTQTLDVRRAQPELYRTAQAAILVSLVIGMGVGLTNMGAKASLTSMVILLLAPVATGMVVWVRHTDPNRVGFS